MACKLLAFLTPYLFCSLVLSQPGGSTVRYVEARSHRFSQRVELPGTVESKLVSTVASEVAGMVIEFPVREGQEVDKGETLASLRKTNVEIRLRQAEAQLEEDRARMKLSERTLERTEELLAKGAVSRQELDGARFDYNAWQGRTQRLQAAIDQLKDDLLRMEIKAPFAGVVVGELTQVGEWLEIGGGVVELLSLERLEVSVDLPERYFGAVRRGMRTLVSFDALPGIKVAGEMTAIIPRADQRARTFPIKIQIPNLNGRIGTGMLALVELSLGGMAGTIVPKDAVVREERFLFVYVIEPEEVVRRIEVQTGGAVREWIEVSGIRPGQKVVTRGNERLREGQVVTAVPEEQLYQLP